jgi:hypothetical protein
MGKAFSTIVSYEQSIGLQVLGLEILKGRLHLETLK